MGFTVFSASPGFTIITSRCACGPFSQLMAHWLFEPLLLLRHLSCLDDLCFRKKQLEDQNRPMTGSARELTPRKASFELSLINKND